MSCLYNYFSWWWARRFPKHVENRNKTCTKKELYVKLVIYEDYNKIHGQQNVKFLSCYVIHNTYKFPKAHQLVIQLFIVHTAGIWGIQQLRFQVSSSTHHSGMIFSFPFPYNAYKSVCPQYKRCVVPFWRNRLQSKFWQYPTLQMSQLFFKTCALHQFEIFKTER